MLLPPAHLRIYYYGTWKPEAFVRAREVRTELVSQGLRPEHRLLDMDPGSAISRSASQTTCAAARWRRDHPEAVEWCQRSITPRYPAFRFHRADLASRAYNPSGRTAASEYRFPFADRSFDFISCPRSSRICSPTPSSITS